MSRTIILAVALVATGCHYHRDTNAPAVIDPLAPPKDVTSEQPEYPDDPGERMVVLTYGVSGGAFGGSLAPSVAVDVAAEVTLSFGEDTITHNDRASRLFIPRGVVLPDRSYGVTLGWSALRVLTSDSDDTVTTTGPIYLQAQRSWLFGTVSGGVAVDPRTGGIGPQIDASYTFYYLRGRALAGDGWELGGGMFFKLPTTWVWSR